MEFKDIVDRGLQIKQKYVELNSEQGVQWDGQDYMAGFIGDVGDLSKIIMAKHGLRHMEDVDTKLAHELADCLWSLIVLSSEYNIDLGAAFSKTMDELEARFKTNT